MDRILSRGIPVPTPPDASRCSGTQPGWDGGLYACMRRVLDGLAGDVYAQRKAMIEPVCADTKSIGAPTASSAVPDQPATQNGD